MHTNHPLAPQLEVLLSLRSRRDASASAHEAYAQHRSWWAWLRDFISSPASETSMLAAEQAVIAMEHGLRSDLSQWVAEATMHAEPAVSVRQRELLARRSDVAARQARLNDLLIKAKKVCRLLETAVSDCEAASTSEFLDMLSSSKAIALRSSMHSGDAKDSLQAAQAGLRKFLECWPKRGTSLDVPEINDTLDFVLDMVGMDFDFMSFFNMRALDNAADACKTALKQFEQQIQPVADANDKHRGLIAQLNSELLRLRQPFFHRVLDGLPPPLKAYAPSSLSL